MFGIGGTELVVILLFAFLIFGPDKMPQMGRTIGRALRQFRNAQDEMNKVIKSEVYDPLKDKDPLKNPFDSASGAKKKSNVAEPKKEETFAERKARMTREKEAAQKAKEQAGVKKEVNTPAKESAGDKSSIDSAAKAAALYGVSNPSATSSEAKRAETTKPTADTSASDDGEEGGKKA